MAVVDNRGELNTVDSGGYAFKGIFFFFFLFRIAYLLTIVSVYIARGLVIAFMTVAQWKNARENGSLPRKWDTDACVSLFIEPLASTLLHTVYLLRQ